jgi:hypothetical protein
MYSTIKHNSTCDRKCPEPLPEFSLQDGYSLPFSGSDRGESLTSGPHDGVAPMIDSIRNHAIPQSMLRLCPNRRGQSFDPRPHSAALTFCLELPAGRCPTFS